MIDLSWDVSKTTRRSKSGSVSRLLCASVRLLQKEKNEQINKSDNEAWELLVHEVTPPAAGLWGWTQGAGWSNG